jgi:CheY-like chemotaxis protein
LVSRVIISIFGGDLRLTSEPGGGVFFRLSLPASNVESTAHTPPTSNEPQSEQYRILVIDDELRLKRALSRMLRPHQVIWCESGEGMLSVLAQDQCFDLVLTDVMMYPMPGWKVLALLHTHYPALTDRFAFMTGGVFTEEAERHIHQSNVPVLAKPLTRSDIMSLIHKLKTASHPS